ncbi:hypothetical protein [Mucilaginibacter segetis]|uniref:Uncharacterized protein n=1 Tax=Mucilaginibacter segetis TaxID=2793071 RepID=A0A934PQD2_9SPHI|nr:hypothetical protein [Mucilaginibacter segetis]MBK0377762.1 hypothetical protein [Mucilaginibacter segetis]
MKRNRRIFIYLIIFLGTFSGLHADAQLGGLLKKAKNKAVQKAAEVMDKETATSANVDGDQTSNKVIINTGFDFIPGDSVLFTENFTGIANGASAKSFKTNGSASIVTVNDEAGKWLALADNATYKFTKQRFYPKHFTIEFDIFAVADKVRDIYPLIFGFTKDNSVSDYNSGNGAYVSVKYYNEHEVNINSSYNDKYLSADFDLNPYVNRKMHVSLMVDNGRMEVYLDKTKLADTQLFLPASPKNFYISAPMQYKNGSKVLVSNFRIATYKK